MLKLGSHPEQWRFHATNHSQRPKINKFLFGCRKTVRKGNRKATEKLKINPKWKFSIISVANCNKSNTRNNKKAILLFMVLTLMMPKIISESHGPHVFKITPAQHKKRRPQESTGVVLANYLPKIKLKNFHNFRVLELG